MTYIITFIAVFITDFLNAKFIKAVQHSQPYTAAFWATFVTLTASIAVINYTNDHWQLVPALLGAALGTYFAVVKNNKSAE